ALTLTFTLLRHRRHRCPCAGGGATHCGRHPPCQGATTYAAGAVALRVVASNGVGRLLQVAGSPLAGGPWLQPAAPAGGLAVASRPLTGGLGRNRLPLQPAMASPFSSLFLLRTR
ncbi:hypothetical protein BHE74_00046377, partial [Ensete ventricosum]